MAAVNRPNAPQNYRTPPAFLDAVQAKYGVHTFDAACTSLDRVAPIGYALDLGLDALERDWNELEGQTVWCNPPWNLAGKFARKAAEAPGVGVRLLCQAAVDSNWFAKYVHGQALVLFLNPRIPFLMPDGVTPAYAGPGGKALGVNRPAMLAVYGGRVGYEPWRWM